MHRYIPIAFPPTLMCKAGASLRSVPNKQADHSTWQAAYLLQERGVNCEILGYHIEAEEVAVDAGARHGEAVHVLVLLTSYLEQLEPLLHLRVNRTRTCLCARPLSLQWSAKGCGMCPGSRPRCLDRAHQPTVPSQILASKGLPG